MGVVIGVCWIMGRVSGAHSFRRVSCVQKLPLATLARLIAISILATHTWHAIVILRLSVLKFILCNIGVGQGVQSA